MCRPGLPVTRHRFDAKPGRGSLSRSVPMGVRLYRIPFGKAQRKRDPNREQRRRGAERMSPRCERCSDRVRSLHLGRGTLGRHTDFHAVAVLLKRTAVGGATTGQKHGQPAENENLPCSSHRDPSCPITGDPIVRGGQSSSHHAPGRRPPLIDDYRPTERSIICQSRFEIVLSMMHFRARRVLKRSS